MKTATLKLHFAFSLILIFAVTACTSTNDIQPVEPVTSVTPASPVSEENIRLETVMQTEYAGYDEMVERGFDVHELDYISTKEEFLEIYLKYYFDEDGYPLDIHINMPGLSLPVALTTTSFSNIYGTREELEAQGYTENETMFYFPCNGEKDWRVGKIGFNKGYQTSNPSEWKYTYYETAKSIYYRLPSFSGNMGDIPFIEGIQERENIIFDLRSNNGGHLTWANNFFKKLGWYTGKIIILYDNSSASAAECFYFLAKCNPDYVYGRPNDEIYFTITDYDVYIVGTNTRGAAKYGFEGMDGQPCDFEFENLGLKLNLPDAKALDRITKHDYDYGKDFIEGRGLLPDAWAVTPEEYIKTMQWYTGDEGLNQLY